MRMPALGGRIDVEFVEVRNSLEHIVCLLFQHQPVEKSNLQQRTTMASRHDMFRYGLIYFDMF